MMDHKFKLLFALLCTSFIAQGQVTFTDGTSNLNYTTISSGAPMAVTDMNNDGLDDVVRLASATNLRIDYQQADGSFTGYALAGSGSSWGMSIADVDENGYNDVIAGGAYNGIDYFTASSDGSSFTRSVLGGTSIFVQNVNFADINNDGSIDFFACHDDGISSPYQNNGSGTLTHTPALINTASTVPSDNSGNYGSIWTDYDNDGDLDFYISKCRLGVNSPGDGRRLNLLFQNDGSNNFTEVAPAAGLQPQGQSWATVFGDLDNDGDLDAVMLNHDNLQKNQLYSNDGDGTFTNFTATSGVVTEFANSVGLGIQVMMADFDNDTYLDFLVTTRSGVHYLFYNDGDMTFTATSPFFSGTTDIQSGATGDLNNDGFVDVIAGFASGYNSPSSGRPDKLYLNNGNSNHWSKVTLTGTESNINGIGAKVIIDGAWGSQMREIRAGESYGTHNSFAAYFGLGSSTAITQITVKWPSGIEDIILNPNIDQGIHIQEGETCQTMTVWNGTSWDNGDPSNIKTAVIQGAYNTASDGSITACALVVKDGFTLTVGANSFANVANNITVESGATLDVLDDASVVQTKDGVQVINNGTIQVAKTTPMLNNRDFMIVGSPMSADTRAGTFGTAIQFRDHHTGSFNADPAVTAEDGAALNFADLEGDAWVNYTGTVNAAEGFLVLPQASATVPDGQSYTFMFDQGTLNTGVVNFPVLFGDDQNDSPNMLSNPYASAIDADLFTAANATMVGAIYFWDHATAPSPTYPGYNEANYDMGDISMFLSGSGGTAGNGGITPDKYIASGQGFAIKALAAGTVEFNNGMRVNGNNTGFRTPTSTTSDVSKDRIWLKVNNATYGLQNQMLIAFTQGATADFEPLYDAQRLATPVSLYSTLDTGEELSIQGREPFQIDQVISIGFRSQIEELQDFTISIERLERFIMEEDVDLFLRDLSTGNIVNLSKQDYSFRANAGNFNNRFELLFSNRVLGLNDNANNTFIMYPNPAQEFVNIRFGNAISGDLQVYDITGRLVLTQVVSQSEMVRLNTAGYPAGIYFVQVGETTKKLIIE